MNTMLPTAAPNHLDPFREERRSPGLHILCADDNRLIREFLAVLFKRAGHQVDIAEDGEAAWLAVCTSSTPFDLIVTDHDMPHLNGLNLVRRLRDSGFAGRIVVYSSSVTAAETEAYRELGVDDVVTKSHRPETLLATIARLAPAHAAH